MWFLPLGRGQDEMVPQHVLWTVRSGASLAALLTPAWNQKSNPTINTLQDRLSNAISKT